jgi:uncharacterized protein YgiM (DUF1202 family)
MSAQTATVHAGGPANVRSGPALVFGVVGAAQPGTTVTVIDTQNDWVQVRLADGTTGYVQAQLLR